MVRPRSAARSRPGNRGETGPTTPERLFPPAPGRSVQASLRSCCLHRLLVGRSDAPPVSEAPAIGLYELHKASPSPASISFTADIAALSFSGSRERTTRLVFGFWFSSRNG